ncbi:tyrosine-type recombinase/integrase [Methylorubrum salsuginis]|uniref:Phage integrase family protein n=1 Tax=Methylorubrum salsuginis TaxID=414703 RepID=A0A1I4E545_9HYPH|nr:tyrosine-type recombinase/integrase [Methylorubrum salsuginis]SFL00393.1 Phage integrase family protein [Methylorubrum salsuginis]
MARKREGASLLYEEDRKQWTIRDYDPATGKRVKIRLDRDSVRTRGEAEKAYALHIVERDRKADAIARERAIVAPDTDDPANQDPRLVSVAAALAFYLSVLDRKEQAIEDKIGAGGGGGRSAGGNAALAAIHVVTLLRHWGDKKLAQVRGQTCRAYVVARTAERHRPRGSKGPGKPISEQTARRELQTLSAAIGAWHREFTLTSRPVVSMPVAGQGHPDWLTEREYARLLRVAQGWRWISSDLATGEPEWQRAPDTPFVAQWRASAGDAFIEDDHLERFLEIGFATGTRSGAILDTRWARHRVDGHMDLTARTYHRCGPDAPSSRKNQPPCRIPDRLLPRLVEWREADRRKLPDSTHVVHERGAALSRVDKAFGRLAALAGLDRRDIDGVMRVGNADPRDDLGMPSPHILRHTRATLLLQAGVSPREVGEFLGMSTKMVERVYGHHHVEYQARAAAA